MFLEIRLTPKSGHVTVWDMARDLAQHLEGFAFRGQSDASHKLSSTLERAAERFSCPRSLLQDREAWMLKQFQRRAHHYLTNLPNDDQRLEWLALIQHYGGPTRLLDFSHSFYVAAFFAVEQAVGDSAVWAVNLELLDDAIDRAKKISPAVADKSQMEIAELCFEGKLLGKRVLKVEPERMNERLSMQQGLFLLATDLSLSFEENLSATFDRDIFQDRKEIAYSGFSPEFELDLSATVVMKIIIPRGIHRHALSDLQRANITSATLFPGLDGFARSLYLQLRAHAKDDEYDRIWSYATND